MGIETQDMCSMIRKAVYSYLPFRPDFACDCLSQENSSTCTSVSLYMKSSLSVVHRIIRIVDYRSFVLWEIFLYKSINIKYLNAPHAYTTKINSVYETTSAGKASKFLVIISFSNSKNNYFS